jgi:hypothetical protein
MYRVPLAMIMRVVSNKATSAHTRRRNVPGVMNIKSELGYLTVNAAQDINRVPHSLMTCCRLSLVCCSSSLGLVHREVLIVTNLTTKSLPLFPITVQVIYITLLP